MDHTTGTTITRQPEPGSAAMAPYWVERRRYLKELRRIPELRQRWWGALFIYLLRRALWCFGFFPVFLAFWIPLVMANFNPVVMINGILPELEAFLASNPEVQAGTIQTLIIAWLSVSFFFLVFDFVLTPFRSPYEIEADIHMRAWEQQQATPQPDPSEPHAPETPPQDEDATAVTERPEQVPEKV
ncbi:hypothetical protein [Tamilnaduibacter salinus]|nr:hypothetical protein [Tamilnaduibacter salinus]